MAELVDALDSGSSRGNSVDVRVILAANNSKNFTKIEPVPAAASEARFFCRPLPLIPLQALGLPLHAELPTETTAAALW